MRLKSLTSVGLFYLLLVCIFTHPMAKEKKIALSTFTDAIDADTSDQLLKPSTVRFLLNCRIFGIGNKGIITNVKGNILIPNILPDGDNLCLGWGSNEEENKFYWFNWNSNGYHGCYMYDDTNITISPIIQNLIDTNGVDIFHFDQDYLINHVDIIQDNLIYWVDGLNKARKFNLDKAVNKTQAGYGTIIQEDFITAYKQTCPFPPIPVYYTDVNHSTNYLYALQFKFAQRFIYDDGEQSNVSDFSIVPLPPNESFLGTDNITYNNNCLNVQLFSGSKLVTQIEVLVKINDLDWQSAIVLDKSQLGISDNSGYVYSFYNDGPLTSVDNIKVNRPYSFMPRVPYVQSFVKLAMTYGNADEGFSVVPITASVAVTSQDLYVADDTESMLNDPSFIVNQTSNSKKSAGIFSGNYWVTTNHFIIGHDVKKGNTFVMTANNGQSDNKFWSLTAGYADSAQTVAARLIQQLRNLGRGIPDGGNGISNEITDGSGNVSWDYTYLGHYNENATTFKGSVNAVNYTTLKDGGFSTNVIKSGSPRKYAIVYEDDDGRKSLAYTCDALLAKTPFITQWGTATLQQPIHTISIFNQPPVWAKYWYLVRTPDITDFTQMLIQSVAPVVVVNEGTYLDMVIGSIFTYQLIHPNTVITYEFKKGDRLRLIKNEYTGDLYTPYFETEVLSYKPTDEQTINANITCTNTSAEVTPSDGVQADYVGKNIIINDIERTIVDIDGANYVLNAPINPTKAYTTDAANPATFPTYIIIDRRGVLRINMPPSTYNVQDLSLIEIYHPQKTLANDQKQNFQECGFKFAVSDYGLDTRAHVGNIQNQDGTDPTGTPAIVQITQGDAYVRDRALPVNSPDNPQDAQVIVDTVEDPNFSDFYQSNLYSLGRVYPQDDGSGVKHFGSRERFSNDYIQDTKINGLNDFDDTDRKDYNDPYGDIMLSRFRRNYLFLFKQFKSTWTPVDQNIIVDNANREQLATSDKLLNDLQYAEWEGGIGDNGSGWFENGNSQYIPSSNSGVFLRIAQDGSMPISSLFFYDKVAREFLSQVSKNKLKVFGEYDRLNDEAIWTYPNYIIFLYKGGFLQNQWNTFVQQYPDGTTFTITQQPANSVATVQMDGTIQITGTNTLGNDFFLYQGNLPGGGVTPVQKFCFTVLNAPMRPTSFRVKASTAYCVQTNGSTTYTFELDSTLSSTPAGVAKVYVYENTHPSASISTITNLDGGIKTQLVIISNDATLLHLIIVLGTEAPATVTFATSGVGGFTNSTDVIPGGTKTVNTVPVGNVTIAMSDDT